MPDMTEQAARASLSPLVARHSPDALARVARGEMVDVPQSTRRSVETVVDGFGEGATVGLIETISEEREAMGALEPQVEEQQTFGAEEGEAAARASEQARQTREADRGARRGESQMDIETATATRRFGEFGEEEEAAPPTERGPGPDDPTRIRGREPDEGPDVHFDANEQGRILHHTEQWAEATGTGPLATLLRVLGADARMNMARKFTEVGIERPEDMIAHFERRGDFEDVEAVGPTTSDQIEAAIPLMREALEDVDAGEQAPDVTARDRETRTVAVGNLEEDAPLPAEVNGWELHAMNEEPNTFNGPAWRGAEDEWVGLFKTGQTYTVSWHSPRIRGVQSSVEIARADVEDSRDEPGEKVNVDEVREAAVSEAVEWMERHDPGEFRHPKWTDDYREKAPAGWDPVALRVSDRKAWLTWNHPGTDTEIKAEGFPGTRFTVTVSAPDWDLDRGPEDFDVVIPSNPTVEQIVERMRRIAERVDVDREQQDVLEGRIQAQWSDLTGQATKALARTYDSVDEILAAPVGKVYDIAGVGKVAITEMVGERVDPRSRTITVQEAIDRDVQDDAGDDGDGHEFEEGDRVRHRDGRTGTVAGTTDIAVTVEWDEGSEEIVSPSSLEAVPEDLQDDNPGNGGNPNGDDDGPGGEETRTILTMGGEPEDDSLEFEAPVEVNGWELIEQDTPNTRGFLGWERAGAEVWIGRFSSYSFRVSSYPGNDQIEMAPNIETALTAARSYMATHDPNGGDGNGNGNGDDGRPQQGRERFKMIEEDHEDDVEQLGLGEGALPDRDREE